MDTRKKTKSPAIAILVFCAGFMSFAWMGSCYVDMTKRSWKPVEVTYNNLLNLSREELGSPEKPNANGLTVVGASPQKIVISETEIEGARIFTSALHVYSLPDGEYLKAMEIPASAGIHVNDYVEWSGSQYLFSTGFDANEKRHVHLIHKIEGGTELRLIYETTGFFIDPVSYVDRLVFGVAEEEWSDDMKLMYIDQSGTVGCLREFDPGYYRYSRSKLSVSGKYLGLVETFRISEKVTVFKGEEQSVIFKWKKVFSGLMFSGDLMYASANVIGNDEWELVCVDLTDDTWYRSKGLDNRFYDAVRIADGVYFALAFKGDETGEGNGSNSYPVMLTLSGERPEINVQPLSIGDFGGKDVGFFACLTRDGQFVLMDWTGENGNHVINLDLITIE